AGLEAGESGRGHRRREIVAGHLREGEELGIDLRAHRVHAKILGAGLAAAGAIETGQRVRAALREVLAQHVARPGARPAAPAGIGTGSIGHALTSSIFPMPNKSMAYSRPVNAPTPPLPRKRGRESEAKAEDGWGLSYGRSSSRAAVGARREPRLDRVPDRRREIDAVEPRDLLDPGRRGHVDFGHVIADDVDPDKYQPLLSQAWPDRGADITFARGQLGLHGPASDMHIGP